MCLVSRQRDGADAPVAGMKSDTVNYKLVNRRIFPLCHPREGGDPGIIGMNKKFYVYILASRRNGTLYTGMSSNLVKRVWEHKNNMVEGFSDRYNVKNLVYFEVHDSAESAITREKQIKK